jgi:SAM-dependent methyltransferase
MSHWCRKVMDEETKKLILALPHQQLDAIEISGRSWKKFRFKSYKNLYYPEFDVCNVPLLYENSCDIVLVEQVFEHVRNPWAAANNINKMLRPGGRVLITTPFYLKVHGAPMDYWRWTTSGLRALLEDSGFTIENVDSWGNKECIVSNFDQWTEYQEGMNLTNNLDLPIMVWALAKKL